MPQFIIKIDESQEMFLFFHIFVASGLFLIP
ncbi:MAG: sortase B protein-sorting domain-containing protein [Alphaproteobacteria bacterium]|nr:sortase B protein-sorting domain-containing protein [Alphaproteobacteria bacterium]